MQLPTFALGLLALGAPIVAKPVAYGSSPLSRRTLGPDENGKYTISSGDLKLQFIPYGAAITNLFVKSSSGQLLDIILGYDNASYYATDPVHPYFGGIVGRYANRIKNSTFTIEDLDGKEQTYNITPNEHKTTEYPDGLNPLHGGPDGWDWRNWTVATQTENSITFSLVDPDGKEGFPGEVISYVTYTVTDNYWDFKIVALATTKRTPIMLSSHAYWNLDGFANPAAGHALNHTLHLPYAGQKVGTDGILIPTGEIDPIPKGSVNDFWSKPKQLGADLSKKELLGNCGFNCTGYDTCYLHSLRPEVPIAPRSGWLNAPVASLSSAFSGIKLDVYSDQDAFQVYNCIGQKGTTPLKSTQGFPGRNRVVEQYGCVVMEVQDWIDGINHPEWGRTDRQVFGPDTGAYELGARYVFTVEGSK